VVIQRHLRRLIDFKKGTAKHGTRQGNTDWNHNFEDIHPFE